MVMGDYFNAETRALLSILQVSETPYQIVEVDTIKDDNMKETYLQENPTGQVPTLLHGNFKIIGATNIFLGYLASCVPKVREKLLPLHDK